MPIIVEGQNNTNNTNPAPPIITTNYVKTWHKFRVVDGQLYDSEKSYKWEKLKVDYLQPITNGAIFQKFEMVTDSVVFVEPGRFGRSTGRSERLRKQPGNTIIVRNYPDLHERGTTVEFRAMQVGFTQYRGQTIALYDYGADHYLPVVTTNKSSLRAP